MRISVVGWYGKNNIGDEAFRPAMAKMFRGHDLEFVTPPEKPTEPDLVILGGGAVASPYYLSVIPSGVRKYAIGIDLAYESESDLLAKANFDGIMFRSQKDVNDWKWKFDCPVSWIPDLSFFLKSSGSIPISTKTKRRIGVFATDYMNPALGRDIKDFAQRSWDFTVKLAKKLDELIASGNEIYIFCCSTGGYGDDRRMALQLRAFMKETPAVILDTFTPQEMIDAIGTMNLCICQRFHAHLFSTIAGTPFVSMGTTRKVKMYLDALGLRNSLTCGHFEGNEFHVENFHQVVETAINDKELPKKLLHVAGMNHNLLADVIAKVRQDWLE